MTGAGVKPNIHNIRFFTEMGSAAFWANQTFRNQFLYIFGKPNIRAMFSNQLLHPFNSGIIDNRFITFGTIENRDWHTPGSLSGNTPVATISNHVINSIMPPGWEEFNFINFIQCFLTEPVYRSKPLLCCTEQRWLFTSPAVRILMLDKFQF